MLNRLRSLLSSRAAAPHPRQRGLPDRIPAVGRERRGSLFPALRQTPPIILRNHARHFCQLNAYGAAAVAAYQHHLIGYGITPAPQHTDAETRKLLSATWDEFTKSADVERRMNIGAMASLVVRSLVTDGEAIIRIVECAGGIAMQPIPPEQLDESKNADLGGGAFIREGVEFDADGRRVAYYILPVRPGDLFASYAPPVRVPSEDVIHLFEPLFTGQVRGLTWFAPVLSRLSELDKLEEAISVGIGVAAMHAGVLVDQNGTAGIPYDGDQIGNVMQTGLEPGTMKVLPSGYDIRFSTPPQAPHAIQFAEHEARAIASGLGIPQHMLTGDLRQANYSSLRADVVRFRQRIESLQWNLIIPQFFQLVWNRVISSAVLRGHVEIPDFWTDPSPYFAVEWFPPKVAHVDPAKEAEALRDMLDMGLMSRRQAVAELGFNVEDLDAEIAADRAREASLGLTFGQSPKPVKEPTNAA